MQLDIERKGKKMQLSVLNNAKRNIVFGIINKLIIMLCPFITRMVVNRILGLEYLGLDSLFNSILGVISLSELGFSAAIVYFMYKPASQNDTETVNALLNLYKCIYRIIGIVILILGFSILPFVEKFISGNVPYDIDIHILYIIYLVNTAISYFLFAYMSSIIVVNQRDDINSIINSATKIALSALQIILLCITSNYYYFIIVMPLFTVINNLWIALVVRKQFPMYYAEGRVSKDMLSKIKYNVGGAFVQKICASTRNSIDSICISAFLGLTLTALYNNYYIILKSVTDLLLVFSNSVIGGIGNHVATKTVDENFQELKKMDFIYMNISGWCTACLLCLYQPFMTLWMGKDALLPFGIVILFSIYFYMLKMGDMRYMYMTANGLFWKHRWRSIVETVLNIVLNIVLGMHFGIYGIIAATMISIISCNFVWANRITFENYFGVQYLKKYYAYQIRYLVINAVVCLVTFGICSILEINSVLLTLLFRTLICVLMPGIMYYLIYKEEITWVRRYIVGKN